MLSNSRALMKKLRTDPHLCRLLIFSHFLYLIYTHILTILPLKCILLILRYIPILSARSIELQKTASETFVTMNYC
jgi:hypothetical protein